MYSVNMYIKVAQKSEKDNEFLYQDMLKKHELSSKENIVGFFGFRTTE